MIRLEQHPWSCSQKRLFSAKRYKALNFNGIHGYPNAIPHEVRTYLSKYSGMNYESANQHLQFFCDLIGNYEIEAEDVVMNLFFSFIKR